MTPYAAVTQTPRLILRQFTPDDSAPLMDVFGNAAVMRYGDGVKTLAWVEAWILEVQNSYKRLGCSKWAVVNRAGDLLGYCGLSYEADVCGQAEVALGYRLARRFWGQGYASEAVGAALTYGFDVLGLERIVATIDPGNAASLRIAEKAGMVYEKDVLYEGYTHPDRVYVAERWRVQSKLKGALRHVYGEIIAANPANL